MSEEGVALASRPSPERRQDEESKSETPQAPEPGAPNALHDSQFAELSATGLKGGKDDIERLICVD